VDKRRLASRRRDTARAAPRLSVKEVTRTRIAAIFRGIPIGTPFASCTRMRSIRLLPLLLATVCVAPIVDASPGTTSPGPTGTPPAVTPPSGASTGSTKIDPNVRAILGFAARFSTTVPGYVPSDRLVREGILPVVIRFSIAPDASRIAALAASGVQWERAGAPLASGVYAAKVGAAQIAILDADPTVMRVTNDLPRKMPRPLDQSALETGIDSARRSFRAKDGTLLDGKGVKIADIDSGLFAFHPAFFRADAGTVAWVDVNHDGKLSPGTDGVDLDGSGSIEPSEVLRVITVVGVDHTSTYEPAVDYLYLDTNGNGVRDYGTGFDETTPAYGEPVFVADDVDQNGKIVSSEKLLRLGTSKVALAHSERTYTRGTSKGILAYGLTITKDDRVLSDAGHGTGVAGILVSGVADRTRLLGLAPGADLLVVSTGRGDPSGTIASVQWAIDQKADIILTEYAPYAGFPLDGSSEEEQLLDSAVDAGVAIVDPAGNLSAGYKHRTVKLAMGPNDLALKTDKYFAKGPYIALTLLHRGDPRVLSMKLTMPDATVLDIPDKSTGTFLDVGKNRLMNVVRETSPRGTHQVHVELYAIDSSGTPLSLPEGKYSWSIDADAPVDAELICADAYNSWARGFTFEENTPSRTICHPATNDKGITVAAYVLHDEADFGPFGAKGALAGYSSLGPRIDGIAGIDLAAPDNPLSTTVPSADSKEIVAYDPFGGTSGAGPHVAAALALVKQAHPELKGAALQDALLKTARKDSFVKSDETLWGKGKLDVAAALGVVRKEGSPPKVTLVAPTETAPAKPFDVQVTIEDDAPGSKVRWDLDYDGKFDTDWSSTTTQTLTIADLGVRTVRVDVLDADGYVRGATANVTIAVPKAEPPPEPPPAVAPEEKAGGCGCSVVGERAPSSTFVLLSFLALGLTRARFARRADRPRSRPARR